MDIGTISSRYAKALFSLAKDKEQESRVYDDMKMLADSFSMEPELRGALSNPIVSVPEKVKLLTAAGGIEVSLFMLVPPLPRSHSVDIFKGA